MYEFELALKEVKPAFGVDNDGLENSVRGGILKYGDRYNSVYNNCLDFVNQIKNTTSTSLLTILLEGRNGSGKTALAAKLALKSHFPFVKMISPENFVGYSEFAKVNAIVKIFEDAYKSPLSLIVLDDIERLIEFIHIGPRFSNAILQNLLVMIKKKPPKADRRLMIIGTTSMKDVLKEMELVDAFNVSMNVPTIRHRQEISSVLSNYEVPSDVTSRISEEMVKKASPGGIPIKNLMLSIDLSRQKS
jgi:vesicle-fusing ATPase